MKMVYYFTLAIIVTAVLLMPMCVIAQGSWQWQNPLPQGADMFAVFALSPNRAIITGSGGTIMTTEDSGQSWHIQRLPQVDWVRKYSFISEYEGWIIGNWYDITNRNKSGSKVFKTNDGGITWQELSISIDIDFSNYRLDGIEFINKETGYLLANSKTVLPPEEPYPGLIYKTVDGGIHWILIETVIHRKYYQIEFTDSLTGFLLYQPYNVANLVLDRTLDGGKTWTTVIDSLIGTINFVNDSIGWAGNYRTTDGGETWLYQQFKFPLLENAIDKISFADSIVGYAISYLTILKTQDGGNSWVLQTETKNGLLQDIQFYNSQIGYACGYSGTVYHTSDGGESWTRNGEGTTVNFIDVDFTDENKGWAVGGFSTILHTENGGNIWEKQNIPAECASVGVGFAAVDFLDTAKGWVIGGEYILKTENGGNDWHIDLKVELVDKSGGFRDIKFLDENIGFAIGRKSLYGSGILYKTIDGGKNWQRVDEGNLPPLAKIYFVDNDYGWICGAGILLYTKDGGNSWYSEYFPEFLRYMQFTDREHGWISAIDEGAFYRTTDGGKTWVDIPYDNRFIQFFKSFFFFNNNQGIASTFLFCNILTTEDGGLNWSYEERLPPIRINTITFVNDTVGWAVGTNGAILKFKGSYFDKTNNIWQSENIAGNYPNPFGNYPNPFNSATIIYFYLSYPQEVFISIYDILGRCIKVFPVSSAIKGMNEIPWQPQKIAGGVYFVRIECNEFTKIIKCLFIK